MTPFLYDVTDRSGNLVIGNATFAEERRSKERSKSAQAERLN